MIYYILVSQGVRNRLPDAKFTLVNNAHCVPHATRKVPLADLLTMAVIRSAFYSIVLTDSKTQDWI